MDDATTLRVTRQPIRQLDPRVVERIAAGEVIERPVSVVKELLENAIDAGAREIAVELRGGGLRQIKVGDDGAGIPADELELAFSRHATSKLREADDLWRIHSLGFRGEALASIGAMAEVLLVSATEGGGAGAGVLVEDGRTVERFARARARGTTVTVRNLFAHQPARLKFMRNARTESAQVSTLVRRYALAYPERRFRLTLDGHTSFSAPGSGRLEDALSSVYGREIARTLLPIEEIAVAGTRIGGVVSGPQLNRPSRRNITFFVNRRWATPRGLAEALEAAYRPFFPRGRHPLAALFLELPANAVDVNVHPAKTEVRLLAEAEVAAALGEGVRAALSRRQTASRASHFQLQELRALSPLSPFRNGIAEEGAPWDTGGPGDAAAPAPDEIIAGPNLPPLRLMGQWHNALLLAEGPDGLYLIDQHRAHERTIYEQLLAGEEGGEREQEPIEPLVLELAPLQAALLDDRLPELEGLGISCENFGGRSFLVRAIPALGPGHEDLREALPDLFDELVEEDEGWRERLMVGLSCRAALRKGRPLDPEERRDLLRQLARTATPMTCPHGAPIVLRLDQALLSRQFRW